MNKLAIAGALALALAAVQGAATQERIRANERYCLLTSDGGGFLGGGPPLCRYETMAQCMASRTGGSDSCIRNPALGTQPIR